MLAFTGSFEKTLWLKRIGAGYIFDYNTVDINATLKEYAPEGVDYYFDNVRIFFKHAERGLSMN